MKEKKNWERKNPKDNNNKKVSLSEVRNYVHKNNNSE